MKLWLRDEKSMFAEENQLLYDADDFRALSDENEGGFIDILIGQILSQLPTNVRSMLPTS